MITRHSTYDLKTGETYTTPDWVYEALWDVFPPAPDPFPANCTEDALAKPFPPVFATNPPFSLSNAIVEKALNEGCRFALLLPATWDTAKSRIKVCRWLSCKLTLTKRIRWTNLEQKKNGPSTNHAWYIWGDNEDCRMLWR
jgi:hypothetical protein